jgi:uncharacterized membrane protein YeaQ/YmgE (transglycosylase-associated protein family)
LVLLPERGPRPRIGNQEREANLRRQLPICRYAESPFPHTAIFSGLLGLIARFVGSKIVDKQGQGHWLNIVLGIVGALVGGFLFDLFGASGVNGFDLYSMMVAIVGSVVVLVIYNALTGRRSRV